MKEKDNKNVQEDEQLHISKSVFQTSKEMQKKAEEEEKRRQEELQKKLKERRKKAEEQRLKRLEQDRLELLKLKTGVITESETIHEEEPQEIHETFFQKIGSFLYLNKWWLGIGAVLTVIAVFLIADFVTKPRPDMVVLVIGDNQAIGEESHLQSYLESLTPDNNGNGKVQVSVYYIPYTGNERADFVNSVSTKLSAELQSADSVILLGNKHIDEVITEKDVLTDLSELYPEDSHVEKKYRYMLAGTGFAEKIGISESALEDGWFAAIRKPQTLIYSDEEDMKETFDKDFPVFKSMISDLSE